MRAFHLHCVEEYYKKVARCMIWGSISGEKGKEPMVCNLIFSFFEIWE
jgi:hypothetical protein